ncbi:hypothetical protein EUTSA_v10027530mg [Eutrema salsugineum]|uniref:Uncharacterized protein n=1 Tax=Eutrema salsugineum TaxID=72664 RepID=V4MR03_EUTSA|nr:hypothetical protein EUTSA_v10027530mg [Eutrema salsugineum]
MEEKSLERLLMQRLVQVVQQQNQVVQPVRLMDLIGDMIGDGDQPREVVMAMVLVPVHRQMEEEKGLDSGLVPVLVQELGLGLAREEEEPQVVVLATEVGPEVKVAAQAVGMVEHLQDVERGANTAK